MNRKWTSLCLIIEIALLLTTVYCTRNVNAPEEKPLPDSISVGKEGGTVSLDSTASIDIPAGALESTSDISITAAPADSFFDDASVKRIMFNCISTAPFTSPVTIRVTAPSGFSAADSSSFKVGYLDSSGLLVAMPFRVEEAAGKLTVSVETTHFSIWDFEFFKSPPEEAMLQVPYYNQGSTNYCWATAMNMICEAAQHIDPEEVFSIVGGTGIENDGIFAISLRFNSAIDGIIRARTSTIPERTLLHVLELGNARISGLLKREISRGYPVELFPTSISHAIVVVGYDADSFYVHNPAAVTDQVATRGMTCEQLVAGMGVADQYITVVIPRELDPDRPLISVNIPHGNQRMSLHFIKSMPPRSLTTAFQWTSTREEGYAFMTGTSLSDTIVDADSFYVRNIEVSNAQTTPATVTVVYDILEASSGRSLYSDRQEVTVRELGLSSVNFSGRATSVFRDSTVEKGDYRFSIRALGNNTVYDAATVDLHMVWQPTFSIAVLKPSSGAPGIDITIEGKGMDTIQGESKVLFGTTVAQVVSWSDTLLRVKVPSSVTGKSNVTVIVKGKTSNILTFTVNGNFVLKRISPDNGSARSWVYLEGKGFGASRNNSSVVFTGDTVDVYRSWNDSVLEVEVPQNARTGPVVVVVNNTSSNEVVYSLKPVLGYITPTSSPVPALVRLHGMNFGSGKDSGFVLLNNRKVTASLWTDTMIQLTVDTTFDTSAVAMIVQIGTMKSVAKTFSSLGKRYIASVNPDSGMIGSTVTLTGRNLRNDTSIGTVYFYPGIAATAKNHSNDYVTVTVPEGAKDGVITYVLTTGDTLRAGQFDVLDTLNILQRCNRISVSVYGTLKYADTARHQENTSSAGFTIQNDLSVHATTYAPLAWDGQQFSASGYDTVNDPYSGIDTFRVTLKGSVSNDYHTVNLQANFEEIWPGNPPQIRKKSEIVVQNVPLSEVFETPNLTYRADSSAVGASVVRATHYYVTSNGIPWELQSADWAGASSSLLVNFSKK